jgi:hypothetical protein
MIPVTGVVVLEYFLIDAGATKWLEYLPSLLGPPGRMSSSIRTLELS